MLARLGTLPSGAAIALLRGRAAAPQRVLLLQQGVKPPVVAPPLASGSMGQLFSSRAGAGKGREPEERPGEEDPDLWLVVG